MSCPWAADPRNLFSRRVLVCTAQGDFKGVMNPGGPPVHISSPEERKKIPEPHDFLVDIGLGARTREVVAVGDMVAMDEPFLELGERIVSKALDNRIACWLGIEVIRALGKAKTRAEIHVAFTAQEEVGLRGARNAAFAVRPDIGIGVDTTLACDTPGVPEQDMTSSLGKGVGIHIRDGSFIADRSLVAEFEALAAKEDPLPAHPAARRRPGCGRGPAGGHRRPGDRDRGRHPLYPHGDRMIDRSDLAAARDLLVAYLKL